MDDLARFVFPQTSPFEPILLLIVAIDTDPFGGDPDADERKTNSLSTIRRLEHFI
ncbi:hypothetical protein FRB97_008729, partial [Tulasnella sp. 331]